ncbi:MAG TPA: zincin-like metallopeptidase domain-containing protein [Methanosarcinales archaeon]|nr:zincin-like metallopeptidase domain-containing protein [Methanosarcinales archaeon]
MENLYENITKQIITMLEKGVKPWEKPWSYNGIPQMPFNYCSKLLYRGINTLILWCEMAEKEFHTNAWLTLKQANQLGGIVLKGEKGIRCVFYKFIEKEDEEKKEIITFPILKTFVLFNLDQIDGIKLEIDANEPIEPITKAKSTIQKTGAKIEHGFSGAFYRPTGDVICMPPADSFHSREDYYATLLHELVHWSGHESRLDRFNNACGKESYAFEELVAEIGSAFLCADLGVNGELQHASYINGWLEILNKNKRAIFKAASLAATTHQFLTDFENNQMNC